MSGAVGSRPSLIRSGTPVASERTSLDTQSASGSNSLQRRLEIATARETASLTGPAGSEGTATEDTDIGGMGRKGRRKGPVYSAAASYGVASNHPTRPTGGAQILVAPRWRRLTKARALPGERRPNRANRAPQKIEIVG